ncbi:hypothetical protein LWI29_015731 [Acer saccharum]|uniref:Uncharacterized protein n=1 Tax=Acer saccharum TaxID=4024 RepID=A0AA39TEW4_ACESA|nr:hypothetical protein LWI29_015731 [Acer saccharum]
MLSSMIDALMCEYEGFDTAQDMWIALKDKFGGTSTTKLRRLTIKFDTYRKRQNHDMRQHLREMSNMIREMKSAGYTLTDEQQIQAVIRSLPNSWENMKINMTHNDNIKTFDDISRHVELEDERLEASKASGQLYVVESSKRKGKKGNFQKGNSHKGKWKGPIENFNKSETKFQKRNKSAGLKSYKFMSFIDRAMLRLRNNEIKDDFDCINEHPVLVTHMLQPEKHTAEVYTRNTFAWVRAEIKSEAKLCIVNCVDDMDNVIYTFKKFTVGDKT